MDTIVIIVLAALAILILWLLGVFGGKKKITEDW